MDAGPEASFYVTSRKGNEWVTLHERYRQHTLLKLAYCPVLLTSPLHGGEHHHSAPS
jgi:hypothetical protein